MKRFPKFNYQILLLEGHISNGIIQIANKKSADLTVIGRRCFGKFKKMVLGSVSNTVLQHASCSILIVK